MSRSFKATLYCAGSSVHLEHLVQEGSVKEGYWPTECFLTACNPESAALPCIY